MMTRAAATVADGILIHGFTTEQYLRTVTLPQIQAGLEAASRSRDDFTVVYPGLVVTATDESEYKAAATAVRRQIAFYGSTPAYSAVLELHGLGELHTELHTLSVRGRWDTMTDLIDDNILGQFAVCGEPSAVGTEIVSRFFGVADRFTLYTPYPLHADAQSAVLGAMRQALPTV
jgi:probable F420-dependent oxidoreductase